MAKNELKKATVVADGREIEVYKHKSTGNWLDFADCRTMYTDKELKFHKK